MTRLLLVGAMLMIAQPFRLSSSMTSPAALAAEGVAASNDPRADIEALIKASGADVAVAFRTLDGRDALLIQPDVEYHAASTMKVPVLIELYRQARAHA